MFFFLSKFALFLFSPFTWFIAAAVCALLLKKDPWKKRMRWGAIAILILFTNSFLFLEFCRMWEVPGKKIADIANYDVGIVLTGMGEYNNDLDELSIRRGADRIWQGLSLYHKGKIKKILISGDHGYITDRGLHEAEQFQKVLISWGIPQQDIITENRSRNTHENAAETGKLLRRSYPHLKKKLLITSGTHMKRALACFEKQNLSCDPFSTDLYTGEKRNYHWDQYIVPNISVMTDWERLTKEWFGYLTYAMVGYL